MNVVDSSAASACSPAARSLSSSSTSGSSVHGPTPPHCPQHTSTFALPLHHEVLSCSNGSLHIMPWQADAVSRGTALFHTHAHHAIASSLLLHTPTWPAPGQSTGCESHNATLLRSSDCCVRAFVWGHSYRVIGVPPCIACLRAPHNYALWQPSAPSVDVLSWRTCDP
jgi:hypothetical protein